MEIDRAALLCADDPTSRAQLDRRLAMARAFRPERRPRTHRRRALVTAFGRFPPHATNATADLACALLDRRATFASTDDARDHFEWIDGVVDDVEVHVVVLPVMWDLAAALALRVIDATSPDLVLMNGIGARDQPIALESEATNLCARRDDVSSAMRPAQEKILPHLDEHRRPLRFDFETALSVARRLHSRVEVARGRDDNAYLCNQLAYLVERALSHPERSLRLLRATGGDEGIDLRVDASLSSVPRAFVHWPSEIAEDDRARCLAVLRALTVRA